MRFDPLKGVPNKREVLAWGLYDLANQAFTLLIITLLFPIYFKKVVVPTDPTAPGANSGDALWGYAGAGSLAIVVLASPFVGALADQFGLKKRILLVTGVLCAGLTVALAVLGPGDVTLALSLFVVANICYQLGENTLAGFLPEIATQRNIGRVSAIGWTMGYVGALALLLIVVGLMFALGLKSESQWRPFFLLAGAWFALGMIAPMVVLRETKPATRPRFAPGAVVARLVQTIRQASHYRQLARFLLAFFVYGLGVQTIIYFAGIIARDFGLQDTQLVIFTLQITVTAGIAAILTGVYQDRIGARSTVMIFLGVWIVTALGLLTLTLIPTDARIA
ncbi:MAG: MFS transporter, partial [Phycisphaerales bacterium JB059]